MPLPITVRVPYGGGIGGVEHHSDSSEAYYMATPGLHVVTPATVADAYGLLRAAIASDDPVVFLEPKRLYWSKDDWSPDEPSAGRTDRPRGGAAPGPQRHAHHVRAVPARLPGGGARRREAEGWDLEVVDLRSLVPVRRRDGRAPRCGAPGGPSSCTSRRGFGGPGGEIAARVTERCFHHLEAPVLRVAGFDIPYPPPMLERHHLPGVDRVLDAVAPAAVGGGDADGAGAASSSCPTWARA